MSNWIPIAKISECADGECIECVVQGQIVALFNVNGDFFALDGICPHQGGPLGKGQLESCTVTCPWHGWQFNVTDGKNVLTDRVVQPQFSVKLEGDVVLVEIP